MNKYLFIGKLLDEKEFKSVMNDPSDLGVNKPLIGGLWSSSYNKDNISDWYRFCVNNNVRKYYNSTECSLFSIDENAKVLTINSYEDLYNILKDENFSRKLPEEFAKMMGGSYLTKRILDFEKIADIYDAIHVTEEGFLSCRETISSIFFNSNKDLDKMSDITGRTPLYVWDCETLLVLNYNIIKDIEFTTLGELKGKQD